MCATTAFAKIITGDANNNYLIESPGDDTLKGLQGNDLLNAELWGDTQEGTTATSSRVAAKLTYF
jgi:hypothetical protein